MAENLDYVRQAARLRKEKNYGSPEGRERRRELARKRRWESLGRKCVSCERTDAETVWSPRKDVCASCNQAETRNGFCPGNCGRVILNRRDPKCLRCGARNPFFKTPCSCMTCEHLRAYRALRKELGELIVVKKEPLFWEHALARCPSRFGGVQCTHVEGHRGYHSHYDKQSWSNRTKLKGERPKTPAPAPAPTPVTHVDPPQGAPPDKWQRAWRKFRDRWRYRNDEEYREDFKACVKRSQSKKRKRELDEIRRWVDETGFLDKWTQTQGQENEA